MMRGFQQGMMVLAQAIGVLAAIVVGFLVAACAPTHFVVTGDPQLSGIRAVYVFPFDSLSDNREAAALLTEAFKAQLQYDRIFQVVEDPKRADAHFKGTVGKWAWGGLNWQGARSSEVSGSLWLVNPTHQPLWVAAAVQRDPLRLIAHGFLARDPRLLAPYWARTVLQQMPGYAVKGRPEITTGHEHELSHPES
jgi:hypothetical protein